MKIFVSLALSVTMLLTFVIVAIPMKKAEAEAPLVLTMPDYDGKTDKTTYVIGQGTEDEVTVHCNFIPTSYEHRPKPNVSQTMEYIVVHNTANWGASANAKAHNTYLTTNSSTNGSYAFVVGSDGIWQNLPDLEYSWHTGGNTMGTNVYHPNAIGIETCDNGAPTKSDGYPAWNTQALYTWYEEVFAQRVGYLAMLVATLCARYDFNPYTQVVQHYDVYGKECPIDMRYVFGTTVNTGSKTEGTYYKIFWEKMIKYYEAYGGKYRGYTTGEYVITVFNTPIYSSPSKDSSVLSTIPKKAYKDVYSVNVTEVSGDYGKVTYNGTTGWIYLQCGVCQDVIGANEIKYTKPVNNFQFTDESIFAKDGIIYGIKENMTVDELSAVCGNTLKVLSKSGDQLTSGFIGTGCKVQSINENNVVAEECVVIVKGDIDGDGQVGQNDYVAVKAVFKAGKSSWDEYQTKASDVCENKKLTISDYLLIKRHVQKTYNIFK